MLFQRFVHAKLTKIHTILLLSATLVSFILVIKQWIPDTFTAEEEEEREEEAEGEEGGEGEGEGEGEVEGEGEGEEEGDGVVVAESGVEEEEEDREEESESEGETLERLASNRHPNENCTCMTSHPYRL